MSTWSEFLANAGRTVEGGLTADQAVRALTLSPAEILGVSDRLGTIEVGKIANLTLTRGDLFTGRVSQLFVDGATVEVRAQAARRRADGERHVDDHGDDRRGRAAGDAGAATRSATSCAARSRARSAARTINNGSIARRRLGEVLAPR